VTYTKARVLYEPSQYTRPSGTNTSAAASAPGYSGTIVYNCTVPVSSIDATTGLILDSLMYFKATTTAAGERQSFDAVLCMHTQRCHLSAPPPGSLGAPLRAPLPLPPTHPQP
jgi:hypothetical protein